jgi:hypothetical protein
MRSATVGVVAKKSRQMPVSATIKRKLETLAAEVTRLRAENAQLTESLEQYIDQWETLDGPAVSALRYLSEREHGHAAAIARDIDVNVQIAECSLAFLLKCQYIFSTNGTKNPARAAKSRYVLAPKGARYLQSRGLHKDA